MAECVDVRWMGGFIYIGEFLLYKGEFLAFIDVGRSDILLVQDLNKLDS